MRKVLFCLALAACSKSPEKDKPADKPTDKPAATKPMEGDTAKAFDPASLPKAGTPPAPAKIDKELDAMWDVPLKTLQGKDAKLSDFKGKALMIVNVASKCGNTPQYATLEALQKKYESQGFTVVGFPCNQFGGQEPGTAEEIQTFCSTTYGVTFPMMAKSDVNGPDRNPVYKVLTPIKDASGRDGDIEWNFEKFVISADGKSVTRFTHKTKPDDPTVIAAVEAALPKK